ncbi:MAG: anti-phage dCTP deaminase [Thermodesulfobacteriota bacterium]
MARPARIMKLAGSSTAAAPKDSLSTILSRRQTEELVIAVCGPLGSGVDGVARLFQEKLGQLCGYTSEYMKMSRFIAERSRELFGDEPGLLALDGASEAQRIEILQDYGNRLRSEYGNDILAQFVVESIAVSRQDDLRTRELPPEHLVSRRHVTIIDSLKHPEEYALLSRVYGKMFYLIGVLCPEKMREDRLTKKPKGLRRKDAVRLIDRDRGEEVEYGQQLLKTIQHADFFISNIHENAERMPHTVVRFIDLMLGTRSHTPTMHEYAMHAAHSAAMRSGCMSRQVGAAIVNASGDLIATGRNDVPCPGGGLYAEGGPVVDARCMSAAGGGQCRSDIHKKDILEKITQIISDHMQPKGDVCVKELEKVFDRIQKLSELRGLIEFSRSVHAEMDAITTVARTGQGMLKGAVLYCTTFPCHHCARHIVASGIRKVYYVEPYEKSLATALHDDSIATEVQDDEAAPVNGSPSKVKIVPFEGVAPKQFINLFAVRERKHEGARMEVDLRRARPVVEKFMDTYKEYEERVAQYLRERLGSDV